MLTYLCNKADTYYKLRNQLCEIWAENLTADETESILSQLDETILYNQQLLSTIKILQSSGLYVLIPPPHRKVADQLHKTNILNYDQHYRHLNRLCSTLYEQKNKTPSFKEKIECIEMPSCLADSDTLPWFSSMAFMASALNSAV